MFQKRSEIQGAALKVQFERKNGASSMRESELRHPFVPNVAVQQSNLDHLVARVHQVVKMNLVVVLALVEVFAT